MIKIRAAGFGAAVASGDDLSHFIQDMVEDPTMHEVMLNDAENGVQFDEKEKQR